MASKIAIIGAGPAGLTIARILYLNNVSSTIYELEISRHARSQGGTLDLHVEQGQFALRTANLIDQFEKYCRHEGEDFILADTQNVKHVDWRDSERGRPEIDRVKLREILLDSVPEDCIKWDHKLRSVDDDGTLHFDNHPETPKYDLVIGADGAWSKVRPLCTFISPFYSGISGVEFHIHDPATKWPELNEMAGKGSYFVFGNQHSLLTQRLGDGTIRTYAMGRRPENWMETCGIDFANTKQAKEAITKDYESWSPELKRFISCADEVVPRKIFMLPPGIRWPTRPGFTLVGDAAHLMSPFAGMGVNGALKDAAELALTIARQPDDLTKAVNEYERDMFPRATQAAMKSWNRLLERFSPEGLPRFLKMWGGHFQQSKNVEGKENTKKDTVAGKADSKE